MPRTKKLPGRNTGGNCIQENTKSLNAIHTFWKTQINEQCSKLPLNKTLIKSDSNAIKQQLKRQIKAPTKLNL